MLQEEVNFFNSFTMYAYNAAHVVVDDNYATVLECFVTTSYLQVAKVNAE